MDTGPVLQTGIRDRRSQIDGPVDTAHNLLNQVFQFLLRPEFPVPERDPPALFEENTVVPVDHDLRDIRIIHQILQDSQFPV